MPIEVDLNAFHSEGHRFLRLQTGALDALIHDLASHHSEIVDVEDGNLVLIWMLQAIGVSIHSVIRLTEERDMAIRDCFGIARSAAETAVNASYIAVGGEPASDRAIRHMQQKRWRDLRRATTIGGKTLSIERNIGISSHDIPGLEAALEEFTNKKGGEVRDWTTLSLEQRIAAVGEKSIESSTLLTASIFTIYRPSSELLHGTFYGVNYFWQGSLDAPVKNRAAFEHLWIADHFVTLVSSIFFAASGAIEAIAAVCSRPEHAARQKVLLTAFQDYADRMNAEFGDDERGHHRESGR